MDGFGVVWGWNEEKAICFMIKAAGGRLHTGAPYLNSKNVLFLIKQLPEAACTLANTWPQRAGPGPKARAQGPGPLARAQGPWPGLGGAQALGPWAARGPGTLAHGPGPKGPAQGQALGPGPKAQVLELGP